MAVAVDGRDPTPVESRGPGLSDARIESLSRGLEIVASRRLSDPEDVAEAVQETLARTVEAVRQRRIPEHTSTAAFASGIHRHVIADILRERYRAKPSGVPPESLPALDPSPLEQMVTTEERVRVTRAVARLPESDRELLRSCFVEGRKLVDIARELGVPDSRIRKRKSRALARLREILLGGPAVAEGHEPGLSPTNWM